MTRPEVFMKILFPILSVLFAFSATGFGADAADVSHADMVAAVMDKSAFIVDVNGAESYAAGHVPGAVSFDADDFQSKVPKDLSTPCIAYCGGPGCGAWQAAAKKLTELGFTNIKHYSLGIKGWKDSGEAVEKVAAKEGEKKLGGAL
jgi:rhodanese-related sulfurtransferase